jgi:hypothetical protein
MAGQRECEEVVPGSDVSEAMRGAAVRVGRVARAIINASGNDGGDETKRRKEGACAKC